MKKIMVPIWQQWQEYAAIFRPKGESAWQRHACFITDLCPAGYANGNSWWALWTRMQELASCILVFAFLERRAHGEYGVFTLLIRVSWNGEVTRVWRWGPLLGGFSALLKPWPLSLAFEAANRPVYGVGRRLQWRLTSSYACLQLVWYTFSVILRRMLLRFTRVSVR